MSLRAYDFLAMADQRALQERTKSLRLSSNSTHAVLNNKEFPDESRLPFSSSYTLGYTLNFVKNRAQPQEQAAGSDGEEEALDSEENDHELDQEAEENELQMADEGSDIFDTDSSADDDQGSNSVVDLKCDVEDGSSEENEHAAEEEPAPQKEEETSREEMGGVLVYDSYSKLKGCVKIEQYFAEKVPTKISTDTLFSKAEQKEVLKELFGEKARERDFGCDQDKFFFKNLPKFQP